MLENELRAPRSRRSDRLLILCHMLELDIRADSVTWAPMPESITCCCRATEPVVPEVDKTAID